MAESIRKYMKKKNETSKGKICGNKFLHKANCGYILQFFSKLKTSLAQIFFPNRPPCTLLGKDLVVEFQTKTYFEVPYYLK